MEKRGQETTTPMINLNKRYTSASQTDWQGRNEGDDLSVQRWFQRIEIVDLEKSDLPDLTGIKGLAILGFSCDTGVGRNQGRQGSVNGPTAIRKICSNLPVHFQAGFKLIDAGSIGCLDDQLEQSQLQLGRAVTEILSKGYRLIIWGGGHELMFGHYTGINNYLRQQSQFEKKLLADQNLPEKTNEEITIPLKKTIKNKLGIINFDAHFDLRKPGISGANSGTGFWQASELARANHDDFNYLALGIQKISNTRSLFDLAELLEVDYVEAKYFSAENSLFVETKIAGFIENVDKIYLTICLDVFSAAFAPGVSASAYTGIMPDAFWFRMYEMILTSGKLISMDIAELNPAFDQDYRTARLAASLSFEFVQEMFNALN